MLKSLINKTITLSPYPELFFRKVYWNPCLHKLISYASRLMKGRSKNKYQKEITSDKINSVFRNIEKQIGPCENSLLLVHSSMEGIGVRTIKEIDQIMNSLRELVGENGTIAMPVFPKYTWPYGREKIMQMEEYIDDFSNIVLDYHYNKKRCWTGALNTYFLSLPGVIRSKFPKNPLAAQGPLAELMMKHNLEHDLAHGRGSAWEYCILNHAKVLFLGISADHCCTLIHTAEDILDEDWPIRGWYKKQKYRILDNGTVDEITVRERKFKWAKYATEKYSIEQLRQLGILHNCNIAGITVEYINDAYDLFQFMRQECLKSTPFYFKVPKKYFKKKLEL